MDTLRTTTLPQVIYRQLPEEAELAIYLIGQPLLRELRLTTAPC